MIVDAVEAVKILFFPLIIGAFAGARNLKGIGTGEWYFDYLYIIIFGGGVILLIINSVINWRRFEYWFEEDELRIESGLFVRKKRYIPFERIQSLDYTEGIFHRPFKLVKVKVETAGGTSQFNADLTAITKEAAKHIEVEMAEAKQRKFADLDIEGKASEIVKEHITSSASSIFSMSNKDLLILATTSGGIGLILSGALVFLSQFADLIPFESMYEEVSGFIKYGFFIIVLAIFVGFLVVWGISVAMTYFSYYGFSVTLDKQDIVITRGLIEKKKATIPLNRVQCVRIIENPFRQLFGYATVVIENAGGGLDEGATINLFPLVKKSMIIGPLKKVFPEIIFEEPTNKLPIRSKRYYYRIHFLWLTPVIGALTYFFYPYGLFSLLIAPIIMLYGLWRHRSGAYEIFGNQLTMRYRKFSLNRVYLMKNRIQSMEIKQNYFHRKKGVATVSARVKSGMDKLNAEVRHMEESEADRLFSWYKPAHPIKETEQSKGGH